MTMPAPAGGSNNRQAQVTVSANVDPFTKSMGVAAKAASAFGDALKKLDQTIFAVTKRAGAMALGGGALSFFGDMKDLQKAMQYQTQMAQLGVQAGVTGKALGTMSSSISDLHNTVPASTGDLMRLATQLAAVGVSGTSQLTKLTAQAEKLAAATNTAPGQLFTGLIQLNQSLGNSLDTVSRYGDSLVTLQQQLGVSSQDVLNFAQNIAPVANKAGIGEASILGLAGAMVKLGADSASGAQVFNTVMNDMSDAVARNTQRAAQYAGQMGESFQQFKDNFKANPAQEFVKFVDTIAAKGQAGGEILDQFGLDGQRMIKVFAAMTSGSVNLSSVLDQSNAAFAQGDATAKASAQAWDTLQTKLSKLQNVIDDIGTTIGTGFIPVVSKMADGMGAAATTAQVLVHWLNYVKVPIIGDWATKWAGMAAGIGLAGGALALFAGNLTKVLGVWRMMSGVIGGSAIRGLRDGGMRMRIRGTGIVNHEGDPTGDMYMHRPMDPMTGASRTQMFMYRHAYNAGASMRRRGPLVDPDASRVGRMGWARGGAGSVALFPLTRAKQIYRQARDTVRNPLGDRGQRDLSATDPWSMQGGYEQVVKMGGDARAGLIKHLRRDGASDWERSMADRAEAGWGDKEQSAQRLKLDRASLGQEAYHATYAHQSRINRTLSASEARSLLKDVDMLQIDSGEKKASQAANFDRVKDKDLGKHLDSAAVWMGQNAQRDAVKQFDAKLGDDETAKLANPFEKLATKIKEISKSVTADTGGAFKEVMAGLKSFFEQVITAIQTTSQKAYAEIVRLKTLAGGGTEAEASAAKAALMPAKPGPMYGPVPPPPPAPEPARAANGAVILGPEEAGRSRVGAWQNNPRHRGVNVEGVANANVRPKMRINDAADDLRHQGDYMPYTGSRMTAWFDRKMPNANLSENLSKFTDGMKAGTLATLDFGKGMVGAAFSLTQKFMMPLMLFGPMVAAGLAGLSHALDQTARDSQFAGEEIQKSLGRQWLSPTQLAEQKAQSNAAKADQDPFGATERKDATNSDFTGSHADTIAMMNTVGGGSAAGVQAVLQQQINGIVQQQNGAPVDSGVQQQLRELLMNSKLSPSEQRALYTQLDFKGQASSNLYGSLTDKMADSGAMAWGSDSQRYLTAQASSDLKGGNAAGAAYLLLNSNHNVDGGSNANFQKLANGLIDQANNGTKDGDANHIDPANKWLGFIGADRSANTAQGMNAFLDQLKGGKGGSAAFGQQLISALKDAGLQVDSLGHVSGDVTKALQKLQTKANAAAEAMLPGGDSLDLAAAQRALNATPAQNAYDRIGGGGPTDPTHNLDTLLQSTQQIDYGAQVHQWNQQMIDDVQTVGKTAKGNPVFDGDIGITSPKYREGLKNAIEELQKLKDSYGSQTDQRWISADALQQSDIQKLSSYSQTFASPGQQLKDQADILGNQLEGGVSDTNVSSIASSVDQMENLYDQQAQSLKQAYMQVHETHIQMARETDDYNHSQVIAQRDYQRQVDEQNYQFNLSQKEAGYQRQLQLDAQNHQLTESIRSMKYSLANAYGNPGAMVQAQYTQGAQATALGMDAQVKMLQDSKGSMDQLSKMGLSTDAIRVLKLDDPANVAQAKRYIQDFANNPDLIKTFNDSIGQRLNIAEAISQDPNNSQFADMKRQMDYEAGLATDSFNHGQQLASDAFAHATKLSSDNFGLSMSDAAYNFGLQMSRTGEDMSRMMEYISQSPDDLIKWAKSSGIPGLQDIADGMSSVAAQMKTANDAIGQYYRDRAQAAADKLAQGNADAIANNAGHSLDQNKNGVSLSAVDSMLGLGPTPEQKRLAGTRVPGIDPVTGAYDPKIGLPDTAGPTMPFVPTQGLGQLKHDKKLSDYTPKNYMGPQLGEQQLMAIKAATDGYDTSEKKATDSIKAATDAAKNNKGTLKEQTDKQHEATDAILSAVDAAGKKADADNIGKDPATRATAVVKAQRDEFDRLTGMIGGVPGSLQNLNSALHNSQDPMKTTQTVAGDLKGAIDAIPKDPKITVTADTKQATGAINDAHDTFKSVISDIVGVLFGNGLIKGWNWIADHLGLNNLDIPEYKGFATGGYTGDGRRYDPAGIVHAGEFVLDQEKTRKHRPLLEAIHRGDDASIPGYSGGGPVATWQQLDAIRQQLFPGSVRTDAYRPGAKDYHGMGEAIDIGWAGNDYQHLYDIAAKLSQVYPNSTELIHNPNGSIKNGQKVGPGFWGSDTWAAHANHVHWAMTPDALKGGGQGNGAYGSTMSILDAIMDPIGYLKTLGGDIKGKLMGEGSVGQAGALAPGKIIDGIGSKIGDWLGNVVGSATNWVESKASDAWNGVTGAISGAWNWMTGGSSVKDQVKQLAGAVGWGSNAEWSALDWIIGTESGWNPNAANKTSSARGLFQKMTSLYGPLESTIAGQTEWGFNYIHDRYKDPINAMAFHKAKGWYANGGIFDSAQTIGVGEAGPEAVLPLNSHGAQFMAQTLKATVGLMGGDPQLAQTLRQGRTAQYAAPARSEMHVHHTDASTNFHGDITVVAQDPNEMGRKLAAQRRMQAITRPMASR